MFHHRPKARVFFTVLWGMTLGSTHLAHAIESEFDEVVEACQQPPAPAVRTQSFTEILNALKADEAVTNVRAVKSEAEILKYIECYKTAAQFDYKKFKSEYVPMLKRASSASGIPFSVLTCFYFRESKFVNGAASGVGAQGIAQFMPATAKGLNNYLFKNSETWMPKYFAENLKIVEKKYKDNPSVTAEIEHIKAMIPQSVNEKKQTVYGKVVGEAELKKVTEAFRKLKKSAKDETINHWAATVEVAFDTKQSRRIWKSYYQGKTAPTSFDRTKAEQAIIGGAVYIKMLENTLGFNSLKDKTIPDADKFVMIASAYNAGPGNFFKHCKITDSPSDCAKKTPTSENKEYITRINNCVTQGSMESTHKGGIMKCADDEKKTEEKKK